MTLLGSVGPRRLGKSLCIGGKRKQGLGGATVRRESVAWYIYWSFSRVSMLSDVTNVQGKRARRCYLLLRLSAYIPYMYSAWGTPFPHESPTKASENMNKH